MEFTAHNIELLDGTRTFDGPLLRDLGICRAALRTLDIVFPQRRKRRIRVADLGCLEGWYAVEFARRGFTAVGIEARRSNFEKCEFVRARTGLKNLHFIHDDVRNISRHGPFDAVFCCGLLYHLDRPREFLETVGQVTRRLLILHTHYATDPPPARFTLSPLTEHEGRQGKWFEEWPDGTPGAEVEKLRWASVVNPRSFWMTKESLLLTLGGCGFPILFEQFDFLANETDWGYFEENARGMFVAIRP